MTAIGARLTVGPAVAGRGAVPHLTAHDILEIDRKIRAALAQMYKGVDSTGYRPKGEGSIRLRQLYR